MKVFSKIHKFFFTRKLLKEYYEKEAQKIMKEYLESDNTCLGIYDKKGKIRSIERLEVKTNENKR